MVFKKASKVTIVLLTVLLAICSSVRADSIKEAIILNDSGRSLEAIEMLDRLVSANEPNAPYLAALIYLNRSDPKSAVKYLRIADSRGDLRGSFALAEIMIAGQVQGSKAEAFALAKKAANGGYKKAQLNLANYNLYESDSSKPVSDDEAIRWARQAYDPEDLGSVYTLAALLHKHHQFAESHDLFQVVADAGEPQAQFRIALNFMTGSGTEKNENLAKKWMLMAATADISDSYIYAYSFLAKSDKTNARIYLEKAMMNDQPRAYFANYLDNLQGFTGPKNLDKAIESLQKAAFLGVQEAIRSLASRYQNGEGVPKSNTKALFWLWKLDPEKYPMKEWEISAVEKQIEVIAALDNFDPSDVLKPYLVSISRSFYTPQVRNDSASYLNDFVLPGMASSIVGDTGLSGKSFSTTRSGKSVRSSDGVTYRITGNSVRGSDGSWGRRIGRSTFFSDGLNSRSSRDGRSIRFSDGTSARISRDGKSTRFSDGTNCRSVGRSTWCY